jgi:hypothetical protein
MDRVDLTAKQIEALRVFDRAAKLGNGTVYSDDKNIGGNGSCTVVDGGINGFMFASTTINRLRTTGLIEKVQTRVGKVYRITDAGRGNV